MDELARRIGRDHELALELWDTECTTREFWRE